MFKTCKNLFQLPKHWPSNVYYLSKNVSQGTNFQDIDTSQITPIPYVYLKPLPHGHPAYDNGKGIGCFAKDSLPKNFVIGLVNNALTLYKVNTQV